MPEVDYAVLSEWFDWIQNNTDVSVDLIGNIFMGLQGCVYGWVSFLGEKKKSCFLAHKLSHDSL